MIKNWPNQNAHMLFSYGVLVGKALWFPALFSTWWVVAFLVAWALVKEFIWDVLIEKSQWYAPTPANDGATVDFVFYMVGLVVTSTVLVLTGHF